MSDSLQPRGTGPRARPTPGVLSPYRLTGVAAPMAVWALHLVVVYSLQGVVCGEALDNRPIAGLSPLAWAVLGLTVASLAGLGWMALRAWRGVAARARLRGMIAGVLGLPRILRKRSAIQSGRKVSIDYLDSILTHD